MKAIRKMKPVVLLLAFLLLFLGLFPEPPIYADTTAGTTEERVLFVGDSRAVDIITSKTTSLNGKKKNGIKVYARDGATFDFLQQSVNKCKMKNFDTLVVWMGTNDSGIFNKYKYFYNSLIKKGKKVIVCNVGPIKDSSLADFWKPFFSDAKTAKQFNLALKKWAKKKDVTVINTYSFIKKNVKFKNDGIHYTASSSKKIWPFILEKLSEEGVSYEY